MEEEQAQTLATIFAAVEDPRIERTKRHKLLDILLIALCGVICGAEGWAEIEEFGRTKEAWLQSFLEWVQRISGVMKGVIAVDGKTLRRSHDRANGKKALHLVSAWASENRLVLAQLARSARNRTRLRLFPCCCVN
jgi:hypothetical protein